MVKSKKKKKKQGNQQGKQGKTVVTTPKVFFFIPSVMLFIEQKPSGTIWRNKNKGIILNNIVAGRCPPSFYWEPTLFFPFRFEGLN